MIQTTTEFLDAVKDDKILSLDKNNFIQKVTDDFESYKMDLLTNDIDHYLLKFKEQLSKEKHIAFQSNQDNGDDSQIVNIVSQSTNDYYASALRNLRMLRARIKATNILKEFEEAELEEGENLLEDKALVQIIEEPEPLIDLSNSKCTEKIIYLKELGVLDFLFKKEPFDKSVGKLAKALVPILGESYTTIQPILNPVIRNNSSKNNPYYNSTTEKVDQIKEHLVHLGVKFDNKKSD